MTIHMTCVNPQCSKDLRARDDQAGKLTDCPYCGTRMRIPRSEGPFVESAEVEPQPGTPAPQVAEGEVLDWIGPADPAALKAAAPPPPEPEARPQRPKHKPSVPPPPPLTHEHLHEEGMAALHGSPPPSMPPLVETADKPAEGDAPGEGAGFARVAVRHVPLPAPPQPTPEAAPEPSDEVDWSEPPEETRSPGRRLLKVGSWVLLVLIVVAPFAYVLAQIAGGVPAGVGSVPGLLIVFGISLFALLAVSVVSLLVLQHRLGRLERQIASLASGHESAHRILHEAVRDTHRRIGLPCPRCHDRIDLTNRGTEFDCPGCGLPIAVEDGRLVDRRRRDEESAEA